MATFGRDHTWALDEEERPDLEAVRTFLATHGDKPFLIFGFTFMVWLYLYELASEHGLDLGNAQALVAQRERAYFRDTGDFTKRLPRDAVASGASISHRLRAPHRHRGRCRDLRLLG